MTQAETPTVFPRSSARGAAWLRVIPPWAQVVLAVISVQVGAALAKGLFDTAGPSGVVFLRTLLAGILFGLIWRPAVRGRSWRDYGYIALYGVSIALMMLAFYAAIDRIPLGIAVTISFTGPLGLAVLGSRKLLDLLWALLAAAGILLLSPVTNVSLEPAGMFLAGLSGVSWVIYILLTRRISRRVNTQMALTLSMFAAAITAMPFGLSGALQVLTAPTLIALSLVVALLSSAVPFGLEFQALKRLSPRAFGLLVSLEPVVAAAIGFIMLNETLDLRSLIGIGLVTAAAAATARSEPEPDSTQAEATV